MKKATIVAIFIIYLASIFLIGFFGMRVKVYGEVRYVTDISISVRVANPNCIKDGEIKDEGLTDEATGYKKMSMTVYYSYAEDGKLDLQIIPTFGFKDKTQEEMRGRDCSYIITPEGYVGSTVTVSEDGVISCLKKRRTFDVTIVPVTTATLDSVSSAGIILSIMVAS